VKFILLSMITASCLSTSAYARPEWADPLTSMIMTCDFMSPYYNTKTCKPNGPPEAASNLREHLGTDFRAAADTKVVSPVSGVIVMSRASAGTDPFAAYIVIKDSLTNEEHVLGHVVSSLAVNTRVTRGQQVAIVANQGDNSHLHWGFNVTGVAPALSATWGWGRAPYRTTRDQAVAKGWRPVL
jgi:murein DD-endopeptidase MepM/ murein hydrolase activator NlpD